MSVRYTTFRREIIVSDSASGMTLWAGQVNGAGVESVLALSGTEDAVALLEYEGFTGPAHNIVRINKHGSILWTATLPTDSPTDAYVSLAFDGDVLTAGSWSGFHVTLNPETGEIEEQVFVK